MLWFWLRPVATAPIGPLAWEPPICRGSGPRNGKKTKKKKKKVEATKILTDEWINNVVYTFQTTLFGRKKELLIHATMGRNFEKYAQ